MPSQGSPLLDIPTPQIPLVHVYPDPDELGRVYQAQLPINATPTAFCAALPCNQWRPQRRAPAGRASTHTAYLAWSDPAPIRIPAIYKWAR